MDRSPQHTDRGYEQELATLREQVLLMGARVEDSVAGAMKAFERRDSALAKQVIAGDAAVDQNEVEIDEHCLRILARRHPVASDLRFVTTTLKVVTDLERIGDLAVSIAHRVLELGSTPRLEHEQAIPRMADIAQGMLRDALDALVQRDVHKARAVVQRDSAVDSRYAALFPALVATMVQDGEVVARALRVQAVGKCIERIADHATNLAEMVVFLVEGKDVRHAPFNEGRDP